MTLALFAALAWLAAAPAEILSYEAALAAADAQNLDLMVARDRLAETRTLTHRAWAAYLPHLSASAGYTLNSAAATLTVPTGHYVRDFGQPTSPPFDPNRAPSTTNPPGQPTTLALAPSGMREIVFAGRQQYGAQVKLSQALLAPAVWPLIQNAYLAQAAAELQVESARGEMLFGVAQLYYGAATLREVCAVQRKLLQSQQERERDARSRHAAGALGRADLLRTELDRTRLEQELARSQSAYASTKIALAAMLARDASFEVELPPMRRGPAPSTPVSQRADVRAAGASVRLARGQARAEAFAYAPNVGVSGEYRWSNLPGLYGRNDLWSMTVGLEWNIWDGGAREASLRAAHARLSEAEHQQRATENKARAEQERALIELRGAEATLAIATEQLELTREAAELAKNNYDAGTTTYIDYADALDAARRAELSVLTERLSAELAKLRVEKVSGAFVGRSGL